MLIGVTRLQFVSARRPSARQPKKAFEDARRTITRAESSSNILGKSLGIGMLDEKMLIVVGTYDV